MQRWLVVYDTLNSQLLDLLLDGQLLATETRVGSRGEADRVHHVDAQLGTRGSEDLLVDRFGQLCLHLFDHDFWIWRFGVVEGDHVF